jgi:hypothetical protein
MPGWPALARIANLYANVVQRYGPQDLGVCFEMITERAARVMRLRDFCRGALAKLLRLHTAANPKADAHVLQGRAG